MRQTGRTTRIVQYVVEQLYNVGVCVATDHTVYAYEPKLSMLIHFKEAVKREIDFRSQGSKKIKTKDIKIEGIPYVKFEVV
jgi:hypothetical protein